MERVSLVELVEPRQLRAALSAALAPARQSACVVALHVAGRSAFAQYASAASEGGSPARIRLGCLTKLLTAELAIDAVAARGLDLDEPAAPTGIARRHAEVCAITPRHLLEHTHGLDDSMLGSAPLLTNGCIDEPALWRFLCSTPRNAEPGEIYSYGNAGAWLVAALLERRAGRSYAALLHDKLSADWLQAPPSSDGGPLRHVAETSICAALGGSLALSATELLALLHRRSLEAHRVWPSERCAGTFGALQALPGWNPLERAVHLGWKAHGDGWFGHASTLPKASALVCVHPLRRLAFVLGSGEHPAPVIAARVFGHALPELFDMRIPMPRSIVDQELGTDAAQYTGSYCCAARSAHVDVTDGTLSSSFVERTPSGSGRRTARAMLRPAADRVFFTEPPALPSFPYVQFLPDSRGDVRYLWNGRFVLRKAAT